MKANRIDLKKFRSEPMKARSLKEKPQVPAAIPEDRGFLPELPPLPQGSFRLRGTFIEDAMDQETETFTRKRARSADYPRRSCREDEDENSDEVFSFERNYVQKLSAKLHNLWREPGEENSVAHEAKTTADPGSNTASITRQDGSNISSKSHVAVVVNRLQREFFESERSAGRLSGSFFDSNHGDGGRRGKKKVPMDPDTKRNVTMGAVKVIWDDLEQTDEDDDDDDDERDVPVPDPGPPPGIGLGLQDALGPDESSNENEYTGPFTALGKMKPSELEQQPPAPPMEQPPMQPQLQQPPTHQQQLLREQLPQHLPPPQPPQQQQPPWQESSALPFNHQQPPLQQPLMSEQLPFDQPPPFSPPMQTQTHHMSAQYDSQHEGRLNRPQVMPPQPDVGFMTRCDQMRSMRQEQPMLQELPPAMQRQEQRQEQSMMREHEQRFIRDYEPSLMREHEQRRSRGHEPSMLREHEQRFMRGHEPSMPSLSQEHERSMLRGHEPSMLREHEALFLRERAQYSSDQPLDPQRQHLHHNAHQMPAPMQRSPHHPSHARQDPRQPYMQHQPFQQDQPFGLSSPSSQPSQRNLLPRRLQAAQSDMMHMRHSEDLHPQQMPRHPEDMHPHQMHCHPDDMHPHHMPFQDQYPPQDRNQGRFPIRPDRSLDDDFGNYSNVNFGHARGRVPDDFGQDKFGCDEFGRDDFGRIDDFGLRQQQGRFGMQPHEDMQSMQRRDPRDPRDQRDQMHGYTQPPRHILQQQHFSQQQHRLRQQSTQQQSNMNSRSQVMVQHHQQSAQHAHQRQQMQMHDLEFQEEQRNEHEVLGLRPPGIPIPHHGQGHGHNGALNAQTEETSFEIKVGMLLSRKIFDNSLQDGCQVPEEFLEGEGYVPILNLGSIGHPEMCMRPCVFFASGTCPNGMRCGFCHLDHPRRPMHLDKRNRETLKSLSFHECVYMLEPLLRQKAETVGVQMLVGELLSLLLTSAERMAAQDPAAQQGRMAKHAKQHQALRRALSAMNFVSLLMVIVNRPDAPQTMKSDALQNMIERVRTFRVQVSRVTAF